MTFSDFWLSVVASIIASILVAITAKITLDKWRQLAIGFGTTALIALVAGALIFAGITVTNEISQYLARSSIQEKITKYTNGHYPEEVKQGYGVEVLDVRQRVFLALKYPDPYGYPAPNPLNNPFFEAEIARLLNDNGFSGNPIWGYSVKPVTAEEMEKLLRKKE